MTTESPDTLAETSSDNTVLVLYAPDVLGSTKPVVGGHCGVSIRIYDLSPMGARVKVDAYQGQAPNDTVALNLNGQPNIASTQTASTDDSVFLYIPKNLLRPEFVNRLTYTVTRGSQNMGTSTPPLEILYNAIRPGIEDRIHGDDGHSELELILPQDVLENGIDADRAAQGVQVCFSYPYCRAYDRIWLNCNGQDVYRDVTPAEAPATPSAEPTRICVTVDKAVFERAGDHPRFVFSYTVTDQVGNGPDTDSPWSVSLLVDVSLKSNRLVAPDLAEDPDDPSDDPKTIDLSKLGSKDLTVLVHAFAPLWQPNDIIRVKYTSTPPGGPAVPHSVEATVSRIPFTYKLMVPNAKVIADSVVRAFYEQVRNGAVIATSKTTTAQVTGAGQNDVLTFTNEPYTIAPAGRLKNVELLLSTSNNTPIPGGKLSLTLPANFMYADGGSGQRDFITDDVGRLSVSRVKGALIPGSYSLSATSGAQVANATVTVTGLGPVGSIPVGNNPIGIAVSPDGTRTYVCNQTSHSVSVIDTATNRVLTNISVGTSPAGIAVSPDGTRAYVSNEGSFTVSVIDTATERVLTTIPVGNHPTGVAVSPDGTRVYVCNYVSNTVSVIDTATERVTNIPVGTYPRGVAVSPDGTRTYVSNWNSNTVSVIDTATNRVLTNIPVGTHPQGIAVSPDGTCAYVCIGNSHTVSVIDTATNRVLTNIPVGTHPQGIAVSPDGTRAYVSNESSFTVSVIDTATDLVLTNIPVGNKPMWVAVSPDGTRIYVSNYDSHTVSVIGG
ncbi:beta-propeller fold lactonase family protein [Pseudomonas sp. PMCC200344]|uniref:beta-propeller fold lactonase family protein n=1 Tax=Pseudomonas sp. PMCC200344 TaxID=3042028 RepID=UPI0024B395FF|nr:beta-propeller fold lactonase family protein [Pseudomonas sp. PMCC200344]